MLSGPERQIIEAELMLKTDDFVQANRDKDVPRILAGFWDHEEFRWPEEGVVKDYGAIKRHLNDWYSDCARMEIDWKSREFLVISREVASLTGVFAIEATNGSGEVTSASVVMTALLVKMDGKWIFVQGHESIVPQ